MSVRLRGNNKLGPKYFGPFQISVKVGQVAYKLILPPEAQIHPTVHVSQLRPFKGRLPEHTYIPEWLRATRVDVLRNPYKILARRVVKRQNKPAVQYLVQWENQEEGHASWVFANDFEQQYPDFPV